MAQAARKTVFVGNIEDSTTAEHLASAFAPFGAVTEVQIPPDPQNRNQHRNFAFVTFTSATSALDAVDNMNLSVLPSSPEKVLKVNIARPSKGGGGAAGRTGGVAPSAGLDDDTPGVWGSRKAVWESEDWLKENESRGQAEGIQATTEEVAAEGA